MLRESTRHAGSFGWLRLQARKWILELNYLEWTRGLSLSYLLRKYEMGRAERRRDQKTCLASQIIVADDGDDGEEGDDNNGDDESGNDDDDKQRQ